MSSRLRDARREALVCADASCPAWMQKECAGWLDELDRAIPSIVVHVLGRDGCDVEDAVVRIDGVTVASRLSGKPISVDPGPHRIRVEIAGAPASEQRVLLTEGERGRPVTVSFAASGAACGGEGRAPIPTAGEQAQVHAPAEGAHRPIPTAAIGFAAFGALALGAGTALEISSLSQKPTFDRCSPHCDSSDVNAWQTKWRIADVSVGVGLVSLALAAYFYVTRPSSVTPSASRAFAPVLRF